MLLIPTPLSAVLGFVFILIGAAAIWLIFEASRHSHDQSARNRRIRAHRIAGYLFIALFCFMTWLMLLRLKDAADELSLRPMLHILVAMVLAPLFLIKVLVARYYKSYTSVLVPLGLTIFTLGFVLIASAAGPYLLRRATIKDISLDAVAMGAARIDLGASESLMERRCSRCHNLERIAGARKDARGWLATINRMRALPGSGISEADARTILSYLVSENSIDSSSTQGVLAVGRALVDTHCNRCHTLDRTYQSVKSPAEWNATVTRMVGYARGTEGFFKPGEPERIIRFLSTTQTPGAVQARSTNGLETAPAGQLTGTKGAALEKAAVSNLSTIGVGVVIAALFALLVWIRPKSRAKATTGQSASMAMEQARNTPVPVSRKPVILQLVRTERQTHDSVSLRFRITGAQAFRGRPGQFFTFDWLLDGQKLARSYSISSSPTQTGFVEIAVKKQPEGRVSSFLNERASIGLTVEARGPLGRFRFQENEHKNIALLAGGSGITPLISILRYIDDVCLDTRATLFYSVRTERDIIFEGELERLKTHLPNFRLVVILTKPDAGWSGPAGHLRSELISSYLGEVSNHTFFLCGPEGYMNHATELLKSLGVDGQRILQERFGGKTAGASVAADAQPQGLAEFARSNTTAVFFEGQSLLEVAEKNGINIPFSCRQGQCGTCATRLIKGEIQMDNEDGLDPALKAQGYVLTCVARAKGDVRLDA